MKKIAVLTVLTLAITLPLRAQAIDAQSQQGYQTPSDALYAALLTTSSYAVSAVIPVTSSTGGNPYVTWSVIRQADSGECNEASQDMTWPTIWTGTDSCGGGLGSPAVHTEATLGDLRTWILTNLNSTQQQTMVVIHPIGVQRTNVKWWCVYQVGQAFCQ